MYKEQYNDFYKKHGIGVHYSPDRFVTIAKLCRGKVLDLGCGTADLLDFYSGEYVGVDVSDVAVNMAVKKFGTKGAFICADLTKEKISLTQKADTVVLAEFLEHIKEGDFDISSILDYIKPDGRIIVSVPNGDRVPDKGHLREFTIPILRSIFSQFGKVRFYNWVGEKQRIIMTCDVGEPNEIKNSLCMIVKNEAKGIEKCVMSAISFVDDVVILVDDSTKDETLARAKKLGDTVDTFKWTNDFSAARNLCQSKAKGEWVLILDGHEYVEKIFFSDFSEYVDNDGIWCRVKYENGLSFRHPRVIRREVQWRDAVHNSVLARKVLQKVALKLIHDRDNFFAKEYEEERSKQRREMISKIMGDRLKKNKKDLRALFYYGVHKQTQKDYLGAVRLYKRYLKYSKNSGEKWYTVFNIAICYMQAKKPRRAFYWAQMTEKEVPHRWENAHLCANILMFFGKFDRALDYLVEAMKDDKRSHTYYPIIRDLGVIWDMIGTCFISMRQFGKATVAFERAIVYIKDEKKRKMIEAKVSALKTLQHLQYTKKENLLKKKPVKTQGGV